MSDPVANAQLEMACRLGAMDDALEALDEGADVNCNGGSPLFVAITSNQRDMVSVLVEKGADISIFEIVATDHEVIIDALMKLAPKEEEESPDAVKMVEVDGKQIRAFDRMIRNKGLAEPFKKGRADEYPAFCDGLRWIAAEECHAAVTEFLEMVDAARKEVGEDGITKFLEDNAARVVELAERYAAADEVPGDLVKEYLKERKKVA